MTKLCACGCGQLVTKRKNQYLRGHYQRGKPRNKETIEKLHEASLGEKNPMFDKHRFGKDAPHYGHHHSEATKRKISKVLKGKHNCKEVV